MHVAYLSIPPLARRDSLNCKYVIGPTCSEVKLQNLHIQLLHVGIIFITISWNIQFIKLYTRVQAHQSWQEKCTKMILSRAYIPLWALPMTAIYSQVEVLHTLKLRSNDPVTLYKHKIRYSYYCINVTVLIISSKLISCRLTACLRQTVGRRRSPRGHPVHSEQWSGQHPRPNKMP